MKKTIGIIMTGLMAVGIGVSANQQSVQAKSTIKRMWKVISVEDVEAYYTASNKSAYVWNTKFTKRTNNLKNYPPNTTWYVSEQVKYNHRVYYKISGLSGKVYGYTWRGNVAPYILKPMNSFKGDADYLNYLNTDKSQKVARAILKLMPNAEVDYKLSYAAAKASDLSKINGYSNVIPLSNLEMKVKDEVGFKYSTYIRYQLQTNAPTAAETAKNVKAILEHHGYTSEKLDSLFKQGYKLGICVDCSGAYSAGKYGYPSELKQHSNDGSSRMGTLVLAK
ncbi:hypothetical protein [Lentilactobacillus senioris]|uniref:hypothetical protein n=1 Tax=Lentilactobacillus senioris TaxID=931534 RepID=UPI0006CF73ED|nr:hypothetical protein [Lentilactobacillus senioris]